MLLRLGVGSIQVRVKCWGDILKLTNFKVLAFDCYGTLIDWERGMLQALRPLISLLETAHDDERVLEDYAVIEAAQEAETPGLVYPEILARVHRRLAAKWGLEAPAEMADRFGASVPNWPAFADSASSLQYLAKYYKLVVLSNVHKQGFAASNQHLEVSFDAIYCAEQIGSYKPDRRNFEYLIQAVARDFDIPRDKILHTAQSIFHDHIPARAMGLANAWIDRRYDRDGWGATKEPETQPTVDFRFNSMADLVLAHQKALRQS